MSWVRSEDYVPRHEPLPEAGDDVVYVLMTGELFLRLLEAVDPESSWLTVDWGEPHTDTVTWHEPVVTRHAMFTPEIGLGPEL